MANPGVEKSDAIVVLSTSPCDHNLLVHLKNEGYKDVYHVYGSTETGGIGYRTQQNPKYSLCRNIFNNNEKLFRNGEELEIQDQLHFFDNATFSILSRLDGAIQIRGYNVNIDKLEGFIRQLNYVKDVGIRVCGVEQQRYLELLIETDTISETPSIIEDIMTLHGNIIYTSNIHITDTSIRNSMGKLLQTDNSSGPAAAQ
jgi:acyl-coenzyme A synthetase/AMP-(fatty) acid ligase